MKNIKAYKNFVNESEVKLGSLDITIGGQPLEYWDGYESTEEENPVGVEFQDTNCDTSEKVKKYISLYKEFYEQESSEIAKNTLLEVEALAHVFIALKGYCNSGIIGAYIMQMG